MYKRLLATSAILIASPAWAAGEESSPPSAATREAASAPAIASAGVAASAAAQTPPAGLTPEQQVQLLQEVQALRERVQALEARSTQVQYSPEAPQHHKLLGDNNLELYGFVQLDAIQDFDRVNPDWAATLRPSRIPTTSGEFGSNGQTIFSVRQSRLGAKASGTISGKPYEAKIEFDLYGTGDDAGQTTIRFRHVYASWGPILVGQTNSVFMDGDLFPNVIDYWGPTGMVFVRTPQIRYTFLDRNGWKAAIALEHATHDIDSGSLRLIDEDLASGIRSHEKLPDLTAQVRYEGNWGHVQLSGILRKVGYDTVDTPDNEPKGSETGWGVNLGTSLKASLATFRLGAVYGRGIATYMNDGGMDLAPSVSVIPGPGTITLVPEAEAVKLLGVTAYVDLQWSKELSSAVGYSFTKVDNTNFQDPTAFHKGEYASGNLLWTPAERIMTGIELLWGRRTDNDGDKGTDLRLQTSFKFNFSSKDIWD
jgi:hypothetical protein